jgi:hypothetical protein
MSNGKMYDIAEKGLGGIRTAFRGSRLGGGEGWFGTQKKLEGVNVSGRGMEGQTHVDPMFSDSKEFRGIIGSLKKRKLLKDLEDLGNRQEPDNFETRGVWPRGTRFNTGQVTGLRYIGDDGEPLDYRGASQERYYGLNRSDRPEEELKSYRDWRPTPHYERGDNYSQLVDESAEANELYKQYAQSPKNLLQMMMQRLGGRRNRDRATPSFTERYDYREPRE